MVILRIVCIIYCDFWQCCNNLKFFSLFFFFWGGAVYHFFPSDMCILTLRSNLVILNYTTTRAPGIFSFLSKMAINVMIKYHFSFRPT